MAVRSKQDEQADAGGGEQARHASAQAQHTFDVELGDGHACGAIGDEADYARPYNRENLVRAQERLEAFLADQRQDDVEGKGHQEDEERHLQRVLASALDEPTPTRIVPMIVMVVGVVATVCTIVMMLVHERRVLLAGGAIV